MSARSKRNTRSMVEKITGFFDIPTSVLPWGLDLEIKNDKELYVDGCTGILEYSEEKIVFVGKCMRMTVFGEEFELFTFADERLKLCGRVNKIEIERF